MTAPGAQERSGDDEEVRPRRSVLYVPGANARALEKARDLPADAVVLDLEDSVAPGEKTAARDRVRAAVGAGLGGSEVAVRVNALGTPWHADDLRAAAGAGPDAVLVPKVSSADDVHRLVDALEDAGAPGRTRLWVMVETPTAVLSVAEIAAASERLAVLVLGTNDLVAELHAERVPGRAPLLPALATCLLASRAHGKAVLDGVYDAVRDTPGFVAECRQARAMGFDGKTLVHPGQVGPCNEVFAPSEDEVDRARRVSEAFAAASAQGRGVVVVDDRMVEELHVREAQRVLALHAAVTTAPTG